MNFIDQLAYQTAQDILSPNNNPVSRRMRTGLARPGNGQNQQIPTSEAIGHPTADNSKGQEKTLPEVRSLPTAGNDIPMEDSPRVSAKHPYTEIEAEKDDKHHVENARKASKGNDTDEKLPWFRWFSFAFAIPIPLSGI